MQHDGGDIELAATTVVAAWPKGSFAESVVVDPSGAIFQGKLPTRSSFRFIFPENIQQRVVANWPTCGYRRTT